MGADEPLISSTQRLQHDRSRLFMNRQPSTPEIEMEWSLPFDRDAICPGIKIDRMCSVIT